MAQIGNIKPSITNDCSLSFGASQLSSWVFKVREAAVGSLHLSGKPSEQRHKRIAKLIIYLNKLRRSHIQENDPIALFSL